MLSMLNPSNITSRATTRDHYFMNKDMNFGNLSVTEISVKQQREQYSLKKESYSSLTSSADNDNNDEQSDTSNNDDVKKPPIEESKDDEKKTLPKPSLIKTCDVQPYDILCGRDKATFNNVGNRRFRVLISMNIPKYEKANTKVEKASVIKSVCDEFRNLVGVRFLKKHKSEEGYYYQLSGSEARKKVGHALRDMSVARQELKVKRDTMMTKSLKQQQNGHDDFNTWITGGNRNNESDPLLEPLPINEGQQLSVAESHRNSQNNQQPQQQPPAHTPAHWFGQQHTPQQRQQPRAQQQFNDLQQALLGLQKQQEQLQQEREQLMQQQSYQQDLLEQQLRNRRHRRQQQQQQQQEDNELYQFDLFFDTMPQQQKRKR